MLAIEGVNHVGIRMKDKNRSVGFYAHLCFELDSDAGFDDGNPIMGSFSFGNMSAKFIRDPDRNVIKLDAYVSDGDNDDGGYSDHP